MTLRGAGHRFLKKHFGGKNRIQFSKEIAKERAVRLGRALKKGHRTFQSGVLETRKIASEISDTIGGVAMDVGGDFDEFSSKKRKRNDDYDFF